MDGNPPETGANQELSDQPNGAFAVTLRALREARAISQAELARRANLNSSYLSRLEKGAEGYRSPRLSTLRQIAEALGLSSAETIQLFRLGRPSQFGEDIETTAPPTLHEHGRQDVNRYDPGEGYILIRVSKPSNVRDVARAIAEKFPDDVRCAAAVYGRYDVVAWVRSRNYHDLISIIDTLNSGQDFQDIRYTQTILARWDQAYLESDPIYNGMHRMAFVFLRKSKGNASNLVRSISPISVNNAQIMHASAITGAYDAALTIRHVNSDSLESLVVQLQNVPHISECAAVPCLSNMIFLGKGLKWLSDPTIGSA
jgi:transcriptional regulator with XRE-family HTH domain